MDAKDSDSKKLGKELLDALQHFTASDMDNEFFDMIIKAGQYGGPQWKEDSLQSLELARLPRLDDRQRALASITLYKLIGRSDGSFLTENLIELIIILARHIEHDGQLVLQGDGSVDVAEINAFAQGETTPPNFELYRKLERAHDRSGLEAVFGHDSKVVFFVSEIAHPTKWSKLYMPLVSLICLRLTVRGTAGFVYAITKQAPQFLENLLQWKPRMAPFVSKEALSFIKANLHTGFEDNRSRENAVFIPMVKFLAEIEPEDDRHELLNFGCASQLRFHGLQIIKMTLQAAEKLNIDVKAFLTAFEGPSMKEMKESVDRLKDYFDSYSNGSVLSKSVPYCRVLAPNFWLQLHARHNAKFFLCCVSIVDPTETEGVWKTAAVVESRKTAGDAWKGVALDMMKKLKPKANEISAEIGPGLTDSSI